MAYIGNNDFNESNHDIINENYKESDSTPETENHGKDIKMDSTSTEESKTKKGWTKMPSTEKDDNTKKETFINRIEQIKEKGQKVRDEEELDDELDEEEEKKWKIKRNLVFGTLIIMSFLAVWNRDKIANVFKNTDNKQTKDTVEETQDNEQDYNAALANNGATIEETDELEVEQTTEEGAYDEILGGQVLAFTDANDDNQVQTRAHDINTYLQASNVMDITDEELCDQIKFINGTYNASNDDEAWDMLKNCLETFAAYSTATAQSANYAGGVVEDNGVHVALDLTAFLTDNCEHRELMDEISIAFQNVLTATQGAQKDKVDASKIMLKLEADLMLGKKETSNGTKLYFTSLTSSEAFIAGLMFQNANATIHSALGENIEITYTDNVGQDVRVKYETLNEYYNPQCDGEYNTENAWAIVNTDLVETAIAKGLDLSPNR